MLAWLRELFWILPLTILALLVGAISLWNLVRLERSESVSEFWSGLTWVASGPILTPFIWSVGSSAFGWTMGGLGGGLYLIAVLPVNGLITAVCLLPLIGRVLRATAKNHPVVAVALAIAIQVGLQVAQLAVLSTDIGFIGDLRP